MKSSQTHIFGFLRIFPEKKMYAHTYIYSFLIPCLKRSVEVKQKNQKEKYCRQNKRHGVISVQNHVSFALPAIVTDSH